MRGATVVYTDEREMMEEIEITEGQRWVRKKGGTVVTITQVAKNDRGHVYDVEWKSKKGKGLSLASIFRKNYEPEGSTLVDYAWDEFQAVRGVDSDYDVFVAGFNAGRKVD